MLEAYVYSTLFRWLVAFAALVVNIRVSVVFRRLLWTRVQ